MHTGLCDGANLIGEWKTLLVLCVCFSSFPFQSTTIYSHLADLDCDPSPLLSPRYLIFVASRSLDLSLTKNNERLDTKVGFKFCKSR